MEKYTICELTKNTKTGQDRVCLHMKERPYFMLCPKYCDLPRDAIDG
jgi:hypothetical protein